MVSSAKGFCLQIKSLELRYVFSYLTIKVKINIAFSDTRVTDYRVIFLPPCKPRWTRGMTFAI